MLKGLKKASKTWLFSYSSTHFKYLSAVKLTHFSFITIGLRFFISTKYFNPFVPYLPFSSLPKQWTITSAVTKKFSSSGPQSCVLLS